MPIRKEDWVLINKAIADAIEPLKPKGWRKALFILREWGVLAATLTLIVALLGIALAAAYQAMARIGKEATFEANTDNDLKGIKGDVATIRSDLAKLNLSANLALSPVEFKASLSTFRASLASARKQDAKISLALVQSLQSKMVATNTDSPNYWPAAAEFISYRSFSTTPEPIAVDLPVCTIAPPKSETFAINFNLEGNPAKLEQKLGTYRSCRIIFDSPEDMERLNSYLRDFATIGFFNCVVVYRGGPVNLRLAGPHIVATATDKSGKQAATLAVSGNSLQFVDCLFDFSIQGTPPPQGQELTKILLAQKEPTLTLSLAPHS